MSAHRYPSPSTESSRYASAFDGRTLCAHDGATEIMGPVLDSSHLRGPLDRIAGFGLAVHSLTPLDTGDEQAGAPQHNQPGRSPRLRRKLGGAEMILLWILLGILYLACWAFFGLATFRKGHYWMFWIGFFLPFLWIIGALIGPTEDAATSGV